MSYWQSTNSYIYIKLVFNAEQGYIFHRHLVGVLRVLRY